MPYDLSIGLGTLRPTGASCHGKKQHLLDFFLDLLHQVLFLLLLTGDFSPDLVTQLYKHYKLSLLLLHSNNHIKLTVS